MKFKTGDLVYSMNGLMENCDQILGVDTIFYIIRTSDNKVDTRTIEYSDKFFKKVKEEELIAELDRILFCTLRDAGIKQWNVE